MTAGTGNLTHPFWIPVGSTQGDTVVESMVAAVPGTSTDRYLVWAVHPEMRDAGRTIAVSVEGTGSQACLAAIPRWDPSWQLPLTFDPDAGAAPVVEGGQRIRIDCEYVNRTSDPLALGQESCRAMIGLVPAP